MKENKLKTRYIFELVFIDCLIVFAFVPALELYIVRNKLSILPMTTKMGIYVGLGTLILNVGIIILLRFIAQKLKKTTYLWAVLIPLIIWMILSSGALFYIGCINENPSMLKGYAIYTVCDSEDLDDYCACRTEIMAKRFGKRDRYDTVLVYNEDRPNLEKDLDVCRKKFNPNK